MRLIFTYLVRNIEIHPHMPGEMHRISRVFFTSHIVVGRRGGDEFGDARGAHHVEF